MSTLTIEMLSDWHIGSGTGRPGSIDRLVKRDADGFPYIPAKTLTGMWRDGCETVAYGLDQGSSGIWTQWVNALFGDQPALQKEAVEQLPQAALLSIRSAQFPIELRSQLRAKPLLKEALSFVKPGVKINAQSGTAEPQCLRFEEMVRGGVQLSAEYHLESDHLSADQITLANAFLSAGAAMVQRLGAKRRRGSGQCHFQIETSLTESIAHLERCVVTTIPVPTQTIPKAFSLQFTSLQSEAWCCVDLVLTTESPVILHKQTLGNLIETLDYIPGTYLLPIISRKLSAAGINMNAAIAQNNLVITNATPEINQQRSQPTPFAFFQEKLNPQQIYNCLGNPLHSSVATPQLKGMRSGYVSNTATPHLTTPRKQVETHNTVHDQDQRPNENVGGLYTYAAIEPGQTFRAALRIRQSLLTAAGISDAPQLTQALSSESIRLGRAKKDDYGRVAFQAQVNSHSQKPSNTLPPGSTLTLWLLSDTLLRDQRLRPTTDPQALLEQLSAKLKVTLTFDAPDQTQNAIARSQRTESWQTRWGLPRPSLVGLSAGSCFQIKIAAGVTLEQLHELEQSGIGERTVEGYGQICFNAPLLHLEQVNLTVNLTEAPLPATTSTNLPIGANLQTYITQVEQAAWRSAIQQVSLSLASRQETRKKILGIDMHERNGKWESRPRTSQLAILRSLLQLLQPNTPEQPEVIHQWLDAMKAKNKGKQSDRWNAKSLDKVKLLLTQRETIWNLFDEEWQKLGFEPDSLTLLNQPEELQRSLWVEAVCSLIDDCLRAQKRDSEKVIHS
jgi:CRISPR-associated protein Csx10